MMKDRLEKYSLEELVEIKIGIDREKYPVRYKSISDLIDKKLGEQAAESNGLDNVNTRFTHFTRYVNEKDVASEKKRALFLGVMCSIFDGFLYSQDEFQYRSVDYIRGEIGYNILVSFIFILCLICFWFGTFGTKKKTD